MRHTHARPPTIKQVAERAGVSPTTVSFVMNGVESAIPAVTKERVWRAVRELGYRPNAMAQALRTRQSNLIGFVSDAVATTPFAVELIKGAQDCARANGKLLLVIDADGDDAQRERAVETMLERSVEGVLYAAMFHQEVSLPERFGETQTVLVDCFTRQPYASVVPDEVQGGREATGRLLEKGHKRVAIIPNDRLDKGYPAAAGRLEGYKAALAASGVPFAPELVREGDGNAESGYACALELIALPEPPTAIFCGTDRIAMGVYEALKSHGLKIPEDVAVIGFDNQEVIAENLRPPLSTMALPHYEMGRWAVERLLSEARDPIKHVVTCPFVERKSL